MTREEAIICLKRADITVGLEPKTKTAEALEMAIKALEQLPKLQNRCYALTYGQMCFFCPYECEHRAESEVKE